MSAQIADTRNAERDPGRGTRRRAPFPEGLAPTRARGDPLPDPGGGLQDWTPNEQGTPPTVVRARRSAFRGIDGVPGRDRIFGSAGTVSNDGRLAGAPAPKPGSSAAVPGARPANWPRGAPADVRKRLRTPNSGAGSDGWAVLRERKTRNPRARIARDSSRYHEQDCQGAFFRTLAGTARFKGKSVADRLHPIEKTRILSTGSIDPPFSGTGPGAPQCKLLLAITVLGIRAWPADSDARLAVPARTRRRSTITRRQLPRTAAQISRAAASGPVVPCRCGARAASPHSG